MPSAASPPSSIVFRRAAKHCILRECATGSASAGLNRALAKPVAPKQHWQSQWHPNSTGTQPANTAFYAPLATLSPAPRLAQKKGAVPGKRLLGNRQARPYNAAAGGSFPQTEVSMQTPRILIVRLSAVGDVIQSMPIACAYGNDFPGPFWLGPWNRVPDNYCKGMKPSISSFPCPADGSNRPAECGGCGSSCVGCVSTWPSRPRD